MKRSILALMIFSLAAFGCAGSVNKAYQNRVEKNLAAVENHFHSEGLGDVDKAIETFTDDVVWDAPAPNGLHRSFSGKEAAGNNYRRLWGAMRNVKFQPVQRFATEDRVVDDSILTFEVAKDGYFNFPVGARVEMRLVHIFEMRDGKIAKEIVFDMGHPVAASTSQKTP